MQVTRKTEGKESWKIEIPITSCLIFFFKRGFKSFRGNIFFYCSRCLTFHFLFVFMSFPPPPSDRFLFHFSDWLKDLGMHLDIQLVWLQRRLCPFFMTMKLKCLELTHIYKIITVLLQYKNEPNILCSIIFRL